MIISERIFEIMKEKNINAKEFAKMTGIGQSTISDWKTKKTNPQANKIMIICEALNVSPEDVLFDTMTIKQKKDKIDKDLEAGKITLNQARKLLDFEPIQ
jgi:transcriptional regulator with XRE-family HTH domain